MAGWPATMAGHVARSIKPVHWVDKCLYWVDGGSINPSTQFILRSVHWLLFCGLVTPNIAKLTWLSVLGYPEVSIWEVVYNKTWINNG